MEIIFGKKFNFKLTGDSLENFKYEELSTDLYMNNLLVTKADGRILVNDGYIPYKKGQIILVIQKWNDKKEEWDCRPIVFDDPAVTEAITEFENTVKNEAI